MARAREACVGIGCGSSRGYVCGFSRSLLGGSVVFLRRFYYVGTGRLDRVSFRFVFLGAFFTVREEGLLFLGFRSEGLEVSEDGKDLLHWHWLGPARWRVDESPQACMIYPLHVVTAINRPCVVNQIVTETRRRAKSK